MVSYLLLRVSSTRHHPPRTSLLGLLTSTTNDFKRTFFPYMGRLANNFLFPWCRSDSFNSYSTSTYKLHYFETATGLKFVITTDPKVPSLQQYLSKLYSEIYVEYVTKNPLYKLGE